MMILKARNDKENKQATEIDIVCVISIETIEAIAKLTPTAQVALIEAIANGRVYVGDFSEGVQGDTEA
jgi:hypothetical protein